MGTQIELTAADDHKFSAYLAEPSGTAKGGLVVIQEIFGVNSHIRSVADGFAADGYIALAPALFDRIAPGIELGYEAGDIAAGREQRSKISNEAALQDIFASVADLSARGLKVAVVGYCWGGSLVWQAADGLDGLSAGISYYGGEVPKRADLTAKCPTMMHFGETDASIPMDGVNAFIAKHPDKPVHVYPAGHGFNCDQRSSYDAASAKLARERTLAFLLACGV
ncbi:MAG: dienelactone hydrolase family protein [Hyphomicrobiaceae bacterium]